MADCPAPSAQIHSNKYIFFYRFFINTLGHMVIGLKQVRVPIGT